MTLTLQLTLLAPNIVEAIVEGRQAEAIGSRLLERFPLEWNRQSQLVRSAAVATSCNVA